MPDRDVQLRPATAEDTEAEHGIFCRSVGELHRAHGYAWEDPPLAGFALGRRHVLAHDGSRCWVAELDGMVVAFTGAFVRGDTWFFSSLFVDPAAQGRGIGRRLFELAVDGAPDRRLTITDSFQPVSNALYGRAGLLPVAPLVRLSGRAAGVPWPELEPAKASLAELVRVDRAAYGFERHVDHPYWASRSDRHAWSRGGEVVAWSYRWSNGNIGPLAAVDAETAAAVFRAELAMDPVASLEVPATARELLRAALGAGLRIEPRMGLLLASDGVPPPVSLAISTYGLY